MNLKILFLPLLFLLQSIGFAQTEEEFNFVKKRKTASFSRKFKNRNDKDVTFPIASFQFDSTIQKRIKNRKNDKLTLMIPKPNGKLMKVKLQKVNITSPNFKVRTSDGKELYGDDYTGVHYQIVKIKNQKTKVGAISFFNNEISGLIEENDNNNIVIVKEKGSVKDEMLVYEDELVNKNIPFVCGTPDNENELQEIQPKTPNVEELVPEISYLVADKSCKVIDIYMEADYQTYLDNGSSIEKTTNFITGMFNPVARLYANIGVNIRISEIFIWTTVDPYRSLTASSTILSTFRNTKTSFNGDLAHLVSTRVASLGGVAYLDVLGNSQYNNYFNYGFSNIAKNYASLPNYSWSVHCVAHELGHNFGSRHTHWCGWQLTPTTKGRIDSCYMAENLNGIGCGTVLKANSSGTIMSYCHLNGGISFAKGFGPLPTQAILNGYNRAIANGFAGNTEPPLADITGPARICEGNTITFKGSTQPNVTCSWVGPNNFTSTSVNVSIPNAKLNDGGTYTATLARNACVTIQSFNVNIVEIKNLPISETFEGATFPPIDYVIINPDADKTFSISNVGGFGKSTKSLKFDNFSYQSPTAYNKLDTFMFPVVNVSKMKDVKLTFDVAHIGNISTTDSLKIMARTSCGDKFIYTVYKKGTNTLKTATQSSNPFTPTAVQWRTETIDLSQFNNGDKLQLAFINRSGNGNNIYIDNINLTGSNTQLNLGKTDLLVDSMINIDNNFLITAKFSANHNATFGQLFENNQPIMMSSLDNTTTGFQLPITGRYNGNYKYVYKLTNSNAVPVETISDTLNVKISNCQVDNLIANITTKSNFAYRFNLNSNCLGYRVFFSRLGDKTINDTLRKSTDPKLAMEIVKKLPIAATGERNVDSNKGIVIKPSEILLGYFNRTALPVPSIGNCWYIIEVQCNGTCNTNNKTKYYVYVLN